MTITEFIGGGYEEMLGRVMTVEDAEAAYYKTHDCLSDDVDAEQARMEKWFSQMDIVVTD